MIFFTVIPRPASNAVTLALLLLACAAMLALSVIFAHSVRIGPSALPSQHCFSIALGGIGVCIGIVQILAASLSGLFSKVDNAVPGTLFVGGAAGPLLLA